MKTKSVILCLIVQSFVVLSQGSIYRSYVPQAPVPPNFYYIACDIQPPVQTKDKGFLISYHPYAPNIHWAYPEDFYVIKTDSNLIPQWKRPYFCRSVALPTGGIILFWNNGFFGLNNFQHTYVQKVTASGTLVWSKMISGDSQLNSGVQYGDKVRLVGSQITTLQVMYFPYIMGIYKGLSLEMDTMGTLNSSNIYDNGSNLEFGTITRNNAGDFFVTASFGMAFAKFNSAFSQIFAVKTAPGSPRVQLNKIDFLGNGNLIASGHSEYDQNYPGAQTSSIFTFNNQGNFIGLKYFDEHYQMSELCRTAQGTFVGTLGRRGNDSLQTFEIDSMLNLIGLNYVENGLHMGSPARYKNGLIIPFFDASPKVLSTSQNGTNCYTGPGASALITGSTIMNNFTFSVSPSNISLSNLAQDILQTQGYTDTCRCGPSPSSPNYTVCSGQPLVIATAGANSLRWHDAPSSGNLVGTGATCTVTPPNVPTKTYYLSDVTCSLSPRSPVTVSVFASPQLSISASKSLACAGDQLTITINATSTGSWNPYSSTTTSIVTAYTTGVIFIYYTSPAGCKATGSYLFQTRVCTGLDELTTNKIEIFPNPSSGEIKIKYDSGELQQLRLYDASGQLVLKDYTDGNSILDIRNLNTGFYYLKLGNNTPFKLIKE